MKSRQEAREDAQMEQFFRRHLELPMEKAVVDVLMSGNDAQCFTTQQYIDARDKYLRDSGLLSGLNMPALTDTWLIKYAHKQLAACPFVVEVSPDVWTTPQLAQQAQASAANDCERA